MDHAAARNLSIREFTYDLPDERIARYPLAERDAAKLLQFKQGEISDHHFTDLPGLLPPGTLLIGNATKVIHARLHFTLGNGREVEIFCLDPVAPVDYQRNFSSSGPVTWTCLIGGNRRWKNHDFATSQVLMDGENVTLKAERLGRTENTFQVRFSWDSDHAFGPLLDAAGNIPLPPYLGREAEVSDKDRYQTIFAQTEGSVAAPTAGLHLSERLMKELLSGHLNWGEITLHVGAGTFKPVTAETLGGHEMHREYFEVDRLFLERLAAQLRSGQPIVSIGTTTTRCLESLYYLGQRILTQSETSAVFPASIEQWVASEQPGRVTPLAAMDALLERLRQEGKNSFSGSTQLMITPGVRLQLVDGLITNFHQPNSTLLLIVAAIVGRDEWQRIYQHALAKNYRFLSYGDGSLLWQG